MAKKAADRATHPSRARVPASKGNVYFFSDAHLGLGSIDDDHRRERTIVEFLEFVRHRGSALFILGDLFDYWFEYRTVVPKGHVRVLGALAALADTGVEISYLAGNHDFWMKSYFPEELGIQVYPHPIQRTIAGKRFLLHHGDGLLKRDTGYRLLKRVLRNRINIAVFSLLHPDVAGTVARWSSRTSRKHTSKQRYESDDMTQFAEEQIRAGYDYVIMGHNHAPVERNLGSGRYVNLGDWIESNSYAVFDGRDLRLERWPAKD